MVYYSGADWEIVDLFKRKDLSYSEAVAGLNAIFKKYFGEPKNELSDILERITQFKSFKHFDWALKDIELIEKKYPKEDTNGERGYLYYEMKNYKRASKYLWKYFLDNKMHPSAYQFLAKTLIMNKELDKADVITKKIRKNKEKY
jgi:hypothetical protein